MRASNLVQFFSVISVVTCLVMGCTGKYTEIDSNGESVDDAVNEVTFNEGKGLRVPTNTAEFIGLRVVDVIEQKVESEVQFTARLYRPFRNRDALSLASGFLSKADAQQLHEDQPVRVKGSAGTKFDGKIKELNREMEKANGQIEVLLEIDDNSNPLEMGNYVEVSIAIGKEESIVSVPKEALLKAAEGNFVYTVSGEHFVRTEVKVGETDVDVIEVKDGLYVGDQIVVNPVMILWMAELQSIRGGKSCCAVE